MLEEALSYLRRGMSVIPVSSTSKMALVRWAGYQSRRPEEEEVIKWFTSFRDASVGIVTGPISGIVVLDVDSRSGNVEEAKDRLLKECPTSVIVRTGSGGYHLYYRHDFSVHPVSNTVGKGNGIDCRATGGMVLAPPSAHASGNRYEWVIEDWDNIGTYSMDLHHRLLKENHQGSESSSHSGSWITSLLRGVTEGGRNDACAKLAGYYAGKRMPQDVALEMLIQWNERNVPPMPESEIRNTVTSVFRTAARREDNRVVVYNGPIATEVKESEVPQSALSLDTFDEYMLKFGQESVRWQIAGWLPEKTVGLVVAPPGSYKTWLLTDLAISVASGRPFLNRYEVANPGPVMFIQQEDFHGQLAERFAVIAATRFGMDFSGAMDRREDTFEMDTMPSSLPIFLHPDRKFRFGDTIIMDALEEHVARIKPKLLILDPLYSTGDTDDFLAKTVQHMFAFKRMRDTYGTSFIVAHHTKKSKASGLDREDAWGSQFLNAFLETGWQVRQNGTGDVFIRRHFKVGSNVPEQKISFDIDTATPPRYEVTLEDANPADLPGAEEKSGPRRETRAVKQLSEDSRTILAYLKSNRGIPLTREEVSAHLDMDISNVTTAVRQISTHLVHRLDGRVMLSEGDT